MARFAPVAPISLLRRLKDHDVELLGKFHLVLAHDIVENRKLWENFLPDDSTVIIDNGVIELGKAVNSRIMREAYDILGSGRDGKIHRIVTLPDTFDDHETTTRESLDYLNELAPISSALDFLYVIQARTPQEIDRAFDSYLKHFDLLRVNWVSIPRRIQYNMGTRMYGVLKARMLQMAQPHIKIHLMGFSHSILDDMICAQELGVEGIDSAVPLRLGQKGITLEFDYPGDQAGPRGSYWDTPHGSLQTQTIMNIHRIRRQCELKASPQALREAYSPQIAIPEQIKK